MSRHNPSRRSPALRAAISSGSENRQAPPPRAAPPIPDEDGVAKRPRAAPPIPDEDGVAKRPSTVSKGRNPHRPTVSAQCRDTTLRDDHRRSARRSPQGAVRTTHRRSARRSPQGARTDRPRRRGRPPPIPEEASVAKRPSAVSKGRTPHRPTVSAQCRDTTLRDDHRRSARRSPQGAVRTTHRRSAQRPRQGAAGTITGARPVTRPRTPPRRPSIPPRRPPAPLCDPAQCPRARCSDTCPGPPRGGPG
ncbi:hypothetical protein TESS_TESS_02137 [Tessaracoccus sp. O5.2]